MPSHPSLPRTTRLENVSVADQEAAFELDGRPVRLDSETQGPSFAALRELHRAALADYETRLSARAAEPSIAAGDGPEAENPGSLGRLFLRLGRWLGRFFGRPKPAAAAAPATTPPSARSPGPECAAPAPEAGSSARSHRTAAARKPVAAHRPEATSPHPAPTDAPLLQSVFADRDGVHLVWRAAGGKIAGREPQPMAITCGLDSAIARRLEDCYGELEKLGYKVVGLEIVRPAAEKPVAPAPENAAPEQSEAKRSAAEPGPDHPPPARPARSPARPRPSRPDPPPPASSATSSPRPEAEPGMLPGL